MSESPRAIVHLDLDAFYAAVEVLENSDLADQPVLIGGSPQGRGVVMTASYAARAHGVHSAMPMARALALCPQAVVLPARHRTYRDYSRRVMDVVRQNSPLMEQMSVDEAYADVTGRVADWDQAVAVAKGIQRQVQDQVGLTASLGVASNKLVAKVASDRDKPAGFTVVPPGDEAAFLAPLPVRVLWGIGPVTARKLAEMEIETVGDLAQRSEAELSIRFGRHGKGMARQAQGIGSHRIVTKREAKSISHETTFSRDLRRLEDLKKQLWRLSKMIARRLQRSKAAAGTVAIKLRYSDFTTLTRQISLPVPTDEAVEIYRAALSLLTGVWQRGRPVRLLGVAGRRLAEPVGQLSLW